MRFIVGTEGATKAVYLVSGDRALNLTTRHQAIGTDLMGLINDPALLAAVKAEGMAGDTVALSDITPALPVERPGKIICLGLNYVDHIKEGGYEIPEYPAIFMRTQTSVMPAGAPMVRPSCS